MPLLPPNPVARAAGVGGLSLALLLLLLPPAAQAQSGPPPGAGGPVEAGVITLEAAQTPYEVTLPGRAVAFARVDIRPRVEGVVEEIAYTPGQALEAGALLFRIGDDAHEAAVAAAAADLASAEASLSSAASTLERYRALSGAGVSEQDVEEANAAFLQAEASVKSAKAALWIAQIDLDRTEIRSPIAGIPDPADASMGALVTANQEAALTTVTQLDPIYVDVQESSARIQRVRRRLADGTLKREAKLEARLTLESGDPYERTGVVLSPSAQVSAGTGTTTFRLQFPNPDRWIMPGQFLRVHLKLGESQGVLVPQGATSRAADGALTAWILRDGKARKVALQEGGSAGNAWIVTGGAAAGDLLIVDNLRNMREGAAVTAVPVTIDATGLAEDAAPAQAPAPAAPASAASTAKD